MKPKRASCLVVFLVFFAVVPFITMKVKCPSKCQCIPHRKRITVFCRSRKLTEVPKDIPKETYTLSLEDNDLRKIQPRSFAHINELYRLILSGVNLTHIVPGIFAGLVSLNYLSLADNKISSLQEDT